jgi:NADH-quinone oxidoreductase subunit F
MKLYRAHILISVDPESLAAGEKKVLKSFHTELKKHNLDKEIKVLETGTLGIYGYGVVAVIYPEGTYYINLTPKKVATIVEKHLLEGTPVKEYLLKSQEKEDVSLPQPQKLKEQFRIVLNNAGKIDPENIEEYIASNGYEAAAKAITEMGREKVINEIKNSNLRGRGGAAFPTGLKWEFTAKAEGDEKYVICNADEGEPGTCKDRLILEGDPHKLIEGMIIAAFAVGAQKGFIYTRGEYQLSISRLEKAIAQARKYGLLGKNLFESDFNFDIELRKGAGAYVCGEETALIESMEGKRGQPRLKPPFPVQHGFRNKPTLVNNVETLSNVPAIILKGADWYRSIGTDSCPGTKVFTIFGNVSVPGLIEVPMGTTLRSLIWDFCGGIKNNEKFKGALVGGAAGVVLGEDLLDVKMDFDSLKEYKAVLGSGSVFVLSEEDSILELMYSVLHFFEHESCGKCTPCRLATRQLAYMVDSIKNKKAPKNYLDKMLSLAKTAQMTAFCALGQSLYPFVNSCIKNYKDEIFQHLGK